MVPESARKNAVVGAAEEGPQAREAAAGRRRLEGSAASGSFDKKSAGQSRRLAIRWPDGLWHRALLDDLDLCRPRRRRFRHIGRPRGPELAWVFEADPPERAYH